MSSISPNVTHQPLPFHEVSAARLPALTFAGLQAADFASCNSRSVPSVTDHRVPPEVLQPLLGVFRVPVPEAGSPDWVLSSHGAQRRHNGGLHRSAVSSGLTALAARCYITYSLGPRV